MNISEPPIFERIYGHLKMYDLGKVTFYLFLVIIVPPIPLSTYVAKMRSIHQENHNRSRYKANK